MFTLPDTTNTRAVIVAHHPDEALAETLAALTSQVAGVIIVDNTPDGASDALMTDLGKRFDFIRIPQPTNPGQAAGLNTGFARALKAGAAWVLTLDQDSVPHPDLVTRQARLLGGLVEPGRVAVLGCNYQGMARGGAKVGFPEPPGDPWFENITAITSGSLTPVAVWSELGGFREEFFIDHVDHDFCLRARARGYKVLIASAVLNSHVIGEVSYHRLLGKRLETSNHSALRRYFWHRNGIRLVMENLFREPRWCLTLALYHFPAGLLTMLLFEESRAAKLRAVATGLAHGVAGVMDRPPQVG